ncbi:MAG: NHL repeat-containing protein [Phycisphaerae bacterium]|nr:NHL repeat-containing protein [Phycisphaerae bacterium]
MNCSGISRISVLVGLLIAAAVVVAVVALIGIDVTGQKGSGLGSEFSYDLEQMGKIDPALILYQESAESISTGFERARAIAVGPGDKVYVAGDKAIRVFERAGALAGEIPLADAPTSLTVTAEGTIYAGVGDHVKVCELAGNRSASWPGLGEKAVLTSIAVVGSDVYVADARNRVIIRYDKSGKLINRIGQKDRQRGIGGFVIPSPNFDLAVADDGLLRVVNPGKHRIEAYTPEGDLEFWWGKFSMKVEGFCGCCNPMNFAMLADGSFVTSEKGLTRVKIYDPQGKFVGVVAGPEQLLGHGNSSVCKTVAECQQGSFDVAVDSAGRILVLDTLRNEVRIFVKKKSSS